MGEGGVATSTEGSSSPRGGNAVAGRAGGRSRALLASAGMALALLAAPAYAQPPPSSGTLLKELGPTVQPPAPQTLPPPLAAPPQAPPIQGGATTLVTDFHIRATQFPEATLKALLKDYIGRPLTLAELQEAAGKISEFYRAHDILARAYIPQQKIENGVVEIIVLEGTLGKITVDPASVSRLDPALATGIVGARAPEGEAVHPRAIQEGVAVLNELPGVAANATLVPGANAGETNADLKLVDRALVSGLVQADNEGQSASRRR
jgi:hemolysin activation/secretion protein